MLTAAHAVPIPPGNALEQSAQLKRRMWFDDSLHKTLVQLADDPDSFGNILNGGALGGVSSFPRLENTAMTPSSVQQATTSMHPLQEVSSSAGPSAKSQRRKVEPNANRTGRQDDPDWLSDADLVSELFSRLQISSLGSKSLLEAMIS